MASSDILLAATDLPGVRSLYLNRPDKRNALSQDLIDKLIQALADAASDPKIYAVTISGEGSLFCAGADLNDIAPLDEAGARACRYLEDLCKAFSAFEKPVVAAVNGPALGGGFELALMCDFIVASETAHFVLPEVRIGLIPGAGGTQRLTAAVGKFRAMKSVLLAEPMTAREAMAAGLVMDVVGPDSLRQSSLDLASRFNGNNKEATRFAKKAICRADALCLDEAYERDLYYTAFGTEEKARGVEGFLSRKRAKANATASQSAQNTE